MKNQLQDNHIYIQSDSPERKRFNSREIKTQENLERITDHILYGIVEEFAVELNQFPISSLGVLMEWDESSEHVSQQESKAI